MDEVPLKDGEAGSNVLQPLSPPGIDVIVSVNLCRGGGGGRGGTISNSFISAHEHRFVKLIFIDRYIITERL